MDVIRRSFFSINEISISNIIENIDNYQNYYIIAKEVEPLSLCDLDDDNEKEKEKEEIIKPCDFYLFHYDYDDTQLNLFNHLHQLQNTKHLIYSMIISLVHLLQGLCLLNENKICCFNPYTMIYNKYREKPVLCDFSHSIYIPKLSIDYLFTILNDTNSSNFIYMPIEIHLFLYIINHQVDVFQVEPFYSTYIKQLNFLHFFSNSFKEKYHEQCNQFLQQYHLLSKKEILNNILERNNTWDVYGISILFIHIFGHCSQVFSLKNTLIHKLLLELVKNIHPDSTQRMSLNKTWIQCQEIIDTNRSWDFINNHQSLERFFELMYK